MTTKFDAYCCYCKQMVPAGTGECWKFSKTNRWYVGCDDCETYAEYYHSSGRMEPGNHDDYDDNDYHDNGYSHSQQSFADRLDYANDSDDPITRAERRMGA